VASSNNRDICEQGRVFLQPLAVGVPSCLSLSVVSLETDNGSSIQSSTKRLRIRNLDSFVDVTFSRAIRQSKKNLRLSRLLQKTYKTKRIDTVRYTLLLIRIYFHPLRYIALHYTLTRIQHQACSGIASSAQPRRRRISSCSTALHASPHCIVPRLVRGQIGGSSTNKYASFSTWGMETCRCGLRSIRADLLI
jgi:hypothetical protein